MRTREIHVDRRFIEPEGCKPVSSVQLAQKGEEFSIRVGKRRKHPRGDAKASADETKETSDGSRRIGKGEVERGQNKRREGSRPLKDTAMKES
eukprot:762739-Hanusia_phi.AAC.1